MPDEGNIISYSDGDTYLNIREGDANGLIFNVHDNRTGKSVSISLNRAKVIALLKFLFNRYIL